MSSPAAEGASSSPPDEGFSASDPSSSLPAACLKELTSKEPERRAAAAREVGRLAHDYAAKDTPAGQNKLRQLLNGVKALALHRTNVTARLGGLLALAHVAVELKKINKHYEDKYAEDLLRPVLTSLNDPNTTMRKAALDALYNVVKVMQFGVREHFTELFTVLSDHATDLDQDVLMAVEMCDRVLKDVVTTDVSIDPAKFVVAVRERLTVEHPFARQYHLSWINTALDMKYTLMARFLPDLLDGILVCLCDRNKEIQQQAKMALRGLMRCLREDMKGQKEPDYTQMIVPLLAHISGKEDRAKASAFEYLAEFVNRSQAKMLPHIPDILDDILLVYSIEKSQMDEHDYKVIKGFLRETDVELAKIVQGHLENQDAESTDSKLDLDRLVRVLIKRAGKQTSKDGTRAAAVRWFCQLQTINPRKMAPYVDNTLAVLAKLLPSANDATLLLVIQYVADVCNFEAGHDNIRTDRFKNFVKILFELYVEHKDVMDAKGKIIIKHFCALTDTERVFITLSELVAEKGEGNVVLARNLANALNIVLFTAPEAFEMRMKLRALHCQEACDLFKLLYSSWSYSPFAAITLSLLCGCYEHAARIMRYLAVQIVTIDLVQDLENIVYLLDEAAFPDLRIRLFDSPEKDELLYVIYLTYNVMRSGKAKTRLGEILNGVPKFSKDMSIYARSSYEMGESETSLRSQIDFEPLLADFKTRFERRRKATEEERMEQLVRQGLEIVDIRKLREVPGPDEE